MSLIRPDTAGRQRPRWQPRRVLVGVLLMSLAAAAVVLVTILQSEPLVPHPQSPDQRAVATGKATLKRMVAHLDSYRAQTHIRVSQQELTEIARLGSYSVSALDTAVRLAPAGVTVQATLDLSPRSLDLFLNLNLRLAPASTGLIVEHFRVGALPLPPRLVLPVAVAIGDWLAGNDQASAIVANIRSVAVEGDVLALTLARPRQTKSQLKEIIAAVQASRMVPGEREQVLRYYDRLVAIGRTSDGSAVTLDHYLRPLMRMAKQHSGNGSAVSENRAMLWAVSIYFSYGRVETLAGKLVSATRPLAYPPYRVTLAGRRDLMQHFIYSAGITLATRQGVGIAAGEFKELLDSGGGGSGFSFADLAADRAGVLFAERAVRDEASARALQRAYLEQPGEGAFFPDVAALQEGLDYADFEREYGALRSADYRARVVEIDKRILRLPVYRDSVEPTQRAPAGASP